MQTDQTSTQETQVDEARREVALFRYGVIADLVQLEPHHRGLYKLLVEKAEREYTIPGSLRRRIAAEAIRGWLRAYRRGGFDALVPRTRADVMYGLKLRDSGRMRQTYLVAFIDDACRLIPFSTFTFSEGAIAYLQVLEQAIRRRGIPKRLYVDSVPRNRIHVLCPSPICA